MNIVLERLRFTHLFRGIDLKELEKITYTYNLKILKFAKNVTFLFQDQKYDELYIIVDGTAIAELVDYAGKNLKIEYLKAPYIIASAILFADENILPVSVTAKTDVIVVTLKKETLLKIFNDYNKILLNFLTDTSNKFTFITKRMLFLGFKTIKEKLANYLLSLKKDEKGFIKLPYTLEELSNYLGVTRPSLSRCLIELEKNGIIKKENKLIKIIEIEKLISFKKD